MSYTVLARKYRSKGFDDVVGQAPIATTLRNAIQTGRVHHGYLFCGTRGVGKTSMARILAKALNCLRAAGPTADPCNECDSCLMIAAGEDVDVIEIDAASNTGVDNIRELRSNAIYRPSRGRFKIYIIDEVHMLSTGAFNALLKTLEEPPAHVKFILATTEPHKVPATIQSRVQRFDFRPIPAPQIAEQLARICTAEDIQADPPALRRIARLAGGSMRDALSLLDQLLSIGAVPLTLELLEQVLPRPGDEQVCELVDKLLARDAAGALVALDEIIASGHALELVVIALMEHVRGMMLLRLCGGQTELLDAPEALRARMLDQAKALDEPAYVFVLSLLEELRRSVRYSGTGRALIEAAIVRLCLMDCFTPIQAVGQALGAAPSPAPAAPRAAPDGPAAPAGGPSKKPDSPSGAQAAGTGSDEPAPAIVGSRPAGPGRPGPGRGAPLNARTSAAPAARPPVARPIVSNSQDRPASIRSANSNDIRKVTANPVVRKAIELFDGTLVAVRPVGSAPAGAAEPANAQERTDTDTADAADDDEKK